MTAQNVFIFGISSRTGWDLCHFFTDLGYHVYGSFSSNPVLKINCQSFYFDAMKEDLFFLPAESSKIDIVINCNALTDVNLCESEKRKAFLLNANSVYAPLLMAKEHNCPFVQISTDFVFPGFCDGYKETSATEPLGVYSKTKLYAELPTLSYKKGIVLRWTPLSSKYRLSHHKDWLCDLIRKKESLFLFTNKTFTPVSTYALFQSLIQILVKKETGIFHVCTSHPISVFCLGEKLKTHFHSKVKIFPAIFQKNDYGKIRPQNNGLKSERIAMHDLEDMIVNE